MASKWWTLIVVSVAVLMLLLDITVVSVALPSISRDLHANFEHLQWVVDAYSLALASWLLAGGSSADRYGRKRVFAMGLALFITASALCGLARTPLMLDLCRAVQGVGGALLFSTALALLGHSFQGRERGLAFGTFGAVTGIGVAIGPLVGGVVTDGLGWRWVFFINVPLGLAGLLVTLLKVEESRNTNALRTDWWGMALFSAALFLLVFALVQGNQRGWTSPLILAALCAAAFLLGLFWAWERHTKDPLLDLNLFRLPTFTGISVVAFALSAAVFSLLLYITLYLQTVLGFSPLGAGVRSLPSTLSMFAIAPLAGRLSVRAPVRLLLAGGLLVAGAGCALLTVVSPSSPWTALIPGFVLQGLGVGIANPPLAASAIGVVEPERGGMASGINSTFRQVGIATGVAAFGAIFQHKLIADSSRLLHAAKALPSLPAALRGQLGRRLLAGEADVLARSLPKPAAQLITHAYKVGFVGGLDLIFWVAAGVAAVGSVFALALVRRRDFVAAAGQGEAVAALG